MADVADIAGLHDVELAALAATGQRAAFGELVRRHGSAVRALVRRMGADAALADDIAQDACLAAFERNSARGPSRPGSSARESSRRTRFR